MSDGDYITINPPADAQSGNPNRNLAVVDGTALGCDQSLVLGFQFLVCCGK